MAWYDRLIGRKVETEDKLNPAQPYYDHKTEPSREKVVNYERAYEDLEVVNRGVNMIVDDASEIPVLVGGQISGLMSVVKGIKRSRVELLLNKEPNPYQDISTFRRNLITDYLLDGNIFVLANYDNLTKFKFLIILFFNFLARRCVPKVCHLFI